MWLADNLFTSMTNTHTDIINNILLNMHTCRPDTHTHTVGKWFLYESFIGTENRNHLILPLSNVFTDQYI